MWRAAALVTAAAAVSGNIQFSRKVDTASEGVTLMLQLSGDVDPGCKDSDKYGSNDCDLQWNHTYTVKLDVGLPAGLGTDARWTGALQLKGLIPLTPIKVNADCPLCGANCSVTVPIVKQTFSFAMPQCSGNGSSIAGSFPITIPASVPCAVPPPCPDNLPALTVTGDITLADKGGSTLLKASFNVKSDKVPVGPPAPPPPTMYSCWDNACAPSGTGTSQEACEAVCGGDSPVPPTPPAGDKYACTGGQCVAASAGVDKQTCVAACA